jgi:hypothetical protein
VANQFKAGDLIRSHDFPPRPERGDCFVEGIVKNVDDERGLIEFAAERDVWMGQDVSADEHSRVGMDVFTPQQLILGEWDGRLVKLERQ